MVYLDYEWHGVLNIIDSPRLIGYVHAAAAIYCFFKAFYSLFIFLLPYYDQNGIIKSNLLPDNKTMSIHNRLQKKFSIYKKWHKKSYAENIHFIILFVMIFVVLYLQYQLYIIIKTT